MITVESLYKSYGDLKVLMGIDYQFKPNKTTAIIGSSGSGKSTLLRCLNLLETPDSGDIFLENDNITSLQCTSNLRKTVGMVFQSFNLFSNKSVLDNITYALRVVKKIKRNEAEIIAKELLETVGLSDKTNTFPHHLSGGQKQRVAIARALAMKPQVLLFDEPTSALDPEMVNEVLSVIKQLSKTGLTSIVVTHEMGFAKEVADEIIYMDKGEIIESGNTLNFFNNPESKRAKEFLNKTF
ncbi:amino acid ABC transporter ATP-binding protein [Mycoplasmatota bacterium WC44]